MPATVGERYDQDTEWCWIEVAGEPRQRLRFHDYAEIFGVKGLYERLFYDELQCNSPRTMRELLAQALDQGGQDPAELRVLDLGAGNGMVAEELDDLGADRLVGVDIIEAARDAAQRDRPGLYDDYLVADMSEPSVGEDRTLREADLNCLTSVAALGFGDIPPAAFANAFNYVAPGGFVAFNLRDHFLEDTDPSGFNLLIRRMLTEGTIDPVVRRRYRHRLSVSGQPLYYVAIVARKTADVPAGWL